MFATKSFTGFMALMMLLALGLAALMLLAQIDTASIAWRSQPAAQKVAIDWLRPEQIDVPGGLVINAHSAKHHGNTEKIYRMLLDSKCAEVAKYCGGSENEFTYICTDPVTGIVGAILQVGNEITTGFYERAGSGYWAKRIPRERWEACK